MDWPFAMCIPFILGAGPDHTRVVTGVAEIVGTSHGNWRIHDVFEVDGNRRYSYLADPDAGWVKRKLLQFKAYEISEAWIRSQETSLDGASDNL